MWINIRGKFLDKERKSAKESEINSNGEEGQKEEDTLLWEDLETTTETLEITEDNISISVNNKLGYFSIDIPLDTSTLEEIISVTIKKMNKVKALLENLK